MTKTIAFFPRNTFHTNIFIMIGNLLSRYYDYDIQFIRELGEIPEQKVFEYEKEIEKIFYSLNIDYSSLVKIQNRYPEADFVRALNSEREFNFFPEYFNYEHISYEKQLRYLVSCIYVFEKLIDQNKISAVVSELLTGLPDSVLYEICMKKGVQYISIRSSKMIPGVIVCDKYYDEPKAMLSVLHGYKNNRIPDELYKKAVEHINDVREKLERPSYMQVTKKRFKLLTLSRFKTLFRRLGKERIQTNSISLYQHPILNPARWAIHRFNNIRKIRKSFNKWFHTEIPENEKYFIYPLHYEPEASTLIRAYHFSDQMCVIKKIARELPLGVRLVVKEHGGNQGYRKTDFYKKLYYLPNVITVPPEYDGRKLIEGSLGVITLTGRMGWEAIIMKKPVIAFGETFWTSFYTVKKPLSWKDLRACLNEITDKSLKCEMLADEDYERHLLAYASSYISCVYDGNFVLGAESFYDNNNVEKIAKIIHNEIIA